MSEKKRTHGIKRKRQDDHIMPARKRRISISNVLQGKTRRQGSNILLNADGENQDNRAQSDYDSLSRYRAKLSASRQQKDEHRLPATVEKLSQQHRNKGTGKRAGEFTLDQLRGA